MLQDNVERYRTEIASLREKGQKMSTATQKHEQTIHTLNEDLKAAKEKLAMAEVCLRSGKLSNFLDHHDGGMAVAVSGFVHHLALRARLRVYARKEKRSSWWSPS